MNAVLDTLRAGVQRKGMSSHLIHLKRYTVAERKQIAAEVARLVRKKIARKCDIANETNLPWQLVDRVARQSNVPQAATCMLLEQWLKTRANGARRP